MANQKDKTQMELSALVKRKRAEIRMEYSILADERINVEIPKLEKKFWREAGK